MFQNREIKRKILETLEQIDHISSCANAIPDWEQRLENQYKILENLKQLLK